MPRKKLAGPLDMCNVAAVCTIEAVFTQILISEALAKYE